MTEKERTPIFVRHLGQTSVGHRVRLGKVGINDRDDVVEGVVLLQRGEQALPVLERVHKKVEELNNYRLPGGIAIKTFYDRTQLIYTTIETVVEILDRRRGACLDHPAHLFGPWTDGPDCGPHGARCAPVYLLHHGDAWPVGGPYFARRDRFRISSSIRH